MERWLGLAPILWPPFRKRSGRLFGAEAAAEFSFVDINARAAKESLLKAAFHIHVLPFRFDHQHGFTGRAMDRPGFSATRRPPHWSSGRA